jgi:hypothetical protein
MRSDFQDTLALYGQLFGRALTRGLKTFARRDGWVLLGVMVLGTLGSALSFGACALPLSIVSWFLYPWLLGEVVRGSRLGFSDVRAAFRRAGLTLATGFAGSLGLLVVTLLLGALGPLGWLPWFAFLLLPLPEVLALDGSSSVGDGFSSAASFLTRNLWPWAAWNVLVLCGTGALTALLLVGPVVVGLALGLGGLVSALVSDGALPEPTAFSSTLAVAGMGLVLAGTALAVAVGTHVLLLLRAFGFDALGDLTHRTRLFRYRSGAL